MNTQEIVDKLWNLCNVLRDDGITYHQYVTELTYIIFLNLGIIILVLMEYIIDDKDNKLKLILQKSYAKVGGIT